MGGTATWTAGGGFNRIGGAVGIEGLGPPAVYNFIEEVESSGRSLAQFVVKEAVLLLGIASAGSMSNLMRVGSATPSPKVMASPVPMVGHEFEKACGGVRNAGAQDFLVALVGEAHGEDRIALGQDGRIEFGRALGDDAQRHAVFAAFLGDARDRPLGRLEAQADLSIGT